ncbi:MAG: Spy/CpxP family protein refolding chaperone [Ignavibacteriaceae bacterium]
MKRLIVWFLCVILLTLCSAGIGNAQDNESGYRQKSGKEMKGMMEHKDNIIEKLKLTDQQKAKIKDLRTAFQKNMVDLRADLKKNKIDLMALISKDKLNRDEVTAAVGKVNSSRDAISLAVANHLFDVYEVFTPEQQKIWKENVRGNRGWRMGGHEGFGRFRKGHKGFGCFRDWHKGFNHGSPDHKDFNHSKSNDKDSSGKNN